MMRPILFLLAFFMLYTATAPAFAQITKTARIELTDDDTRVFFGENIYITPDPERRLSAAIVAMRHENNLRGARQESNVLRLGPDIQPYWLLFSVTNSSSTENWVLHFGSVLSGRMGIARILTASNQTTDKTLADTTQATQDPARSLSGAALPLTIPRGKTQTFVLYIEPEDGLPATFAPALLTEDSFLGLLKFSFLPAVLKTFLLLTLGAFLTLGLLRRSLSYLLFAGYFGIYLVIFLLLDGLFVAPFFFTGEVLVFLFSLSMLWALGTTRLFLAIEAEEYIENALLFSVASLVTVATLLSFMVFNKNSVFDDLLIYVPHLIAAALTAGLCFQLGQHGRPGGLYLAGAWASLFLSQLLSSAAYLGLAGVNAFNMNAIWYGLIPQAAFFLLATLKKIESDDAVDRSLIVRENRAAQSLARLKQSKESADQARLLRVIERERELMTDLREREIQRTDEMRKAKDMADKANQAKSAFLAVVSHEIRTPMNGIMGIVRLLKDTKLTRDQSDYLLAIQKSGDTMMTLLNDILDFEKIESGNMDLENIEFDLKALVQGVVTLMSGHAATKHLALQYDVTENFPPSLKGDPTRLRQILLNLVSNAIKFTESGSVTIRLRATKVEKKHASIKGDYEIYCAVEDTGIGVADDVQEKLFTPFQQADMSIARKYGGTGLGLAICKRLVEAMGSSIRISSAAGTGSTFFFTILMEAGDGTMAPDSEKENQARAIAPPLHLLIVEDNEINRKVLQTLLEKDGHTIAVSDTGEVAISLCQGNNFDAILMDINLAGMSGLETAKTIRAQPDKRKAAIPMVAITGNVSKDDIAAITGSGFNNYLAKPVDFDKLRQILSDVHGGKYTVHVSAPVPQVRKPYYGDGQRMESSYAPEDEDGTAIHRFLELRQNQAETENDFDSFSEDPRENITPSGVIDETMFKNLVSSLGKKQVTDLMKGFIEKSDEIVASMQELRNGKDVDAIRDRAHELKGMAANFGIRELADVAKAIEKAAKNNDMQAAQASLEALPEANSRAKRAIAAILR